MNQKLETMVDVTVKLKRLPNAEGLPLPQPATPEAAGVDLRAAIEGSMLVPPGERAKIPTGISMEIPNGWEGQVRPRSGLAWKYGVSLVNAPGTIDADYRGEIAVLVVNHGSDSWTIERGDRIAQLVIQRVPRVAWEEVQTLTETVRGKGGFGHTGVE